MLQDPQRKSRGLPGAAPCRSRDSLPATKCEPQTWQWPGLAPGARVSSDPGGRATYRAGLGGQLPDAEGGPTHGHLSRRGGPHRRRRTSLRKGLVGGREPRASVLQLCPLHAARALLLFPPGGHARTFAHSHCAQALLAAP